MTTRSFSELNSVQEHLDQYIKDTYALRLKQAEEAEACTAALIDQLCSEHPEINEEIKQAFLASLTSPAGQTVSFQFEVLKQTLDAIVTDISAAIALEDVELKNKALTALLVQMSTFRRMMLKLDEDTK